MEVLPTEMNATVRFNCSSCGAMSALYDITQFVHGAKIICHICGNQDYCNPLQYTIQPRPVSEVLLKDIMAGERDRVVIDSLVDIGYSEGEIKKMIFYCRNRDHTLYGHELLRACLALQKRK